MKKNYVKLKIKMLLLVMFVLLLGTTLLTYQKADDIREEYLSLVREQMGIDTGIRWNAEECESDMILRVYEAYAGVKSISDDVGFYSMLKTTDGNLLAEDQNFILVKKVENDQYVDARVILLGDVDVSENERVQHGFAGGFYEATEIYGTCDETYIYLDELKWKTLSEEWFSYQPEKAGEVEGTVAFEEWAGSNYFHEADTPYYYHVIPSFAFSLYGDWDSCKQRNEEAKQICERIYSDFVNDLIIMDYQGEEGIFTCYVGEVGYIKENLIMPYVFVFHPVSMAMEELLGIYILTVLLGLLIIAFLWFAIDKVEKQQIAYEMNRRQLTRGIAHELKTPLAITKGYIENWEYLGEETRSECTKTMIEEIEYMNQMVTDLLELSRLEAKAKALELESVDVYALTQSVLGRMKGLIEEKGLQVIIDEQIPRDKFLVQADLEMLRVVILNYVSNAVKYAKKEIQIDISENRKKVCFTIINDGQIIEKGMENQVWDEFYKSDKAEATRMGSSGLGLAIAKNILVLHGAQCGCKSQGGKTKFWFEVKLQQG